MASTAIPIHCVTAAPTAESPWATEQNEAVRLARQGDTATALPIIERLRRAHPDDLRLTRDFIVVSAWAGRDSEATRIFVALPSGPQPDYVLEAVALAYRHLKQPAEALTLYRQGLRQSPANPVFAAGEIRCLADIGQAEPAAALADANLLARGDRMEVLLAAGYVASLQKIPVEALRYLDRALVLDPAAREARHDRILAIDEMGAPQVSQSLSDENPGLLTPLERRRVDGDAAAALVRWGVFEPPSEQLRFAASDRAIAALDAVIARWSQEGAASHEALLRARFDRMVALRDRVRMADVIAEYEDLTRQSIAIPGYALIAAADAYSYLHHPETARDLYLKGLESDPRNPETRLALFYTYVDLGDFVAAYGEVDKAAADQAIWTYMKGLKEPIENGYRATADLASANARFYAGELAEADRRVTAMVQAAPNNTQYLSALAAIYSARGWPRRAGEEYDISRALKPRNLATELGQANNNLLLRDYPKVEAQLADLKERFPENLELQRLDRLWQVHNMAEFRLSVEQAIRSNTNVQGGSGIAVDAQIYSAPLAYNWRIFGGEYATQEQLPQGEGAITLRRSNVGAEYRGGDLVASLEGTVSAYGQRGGPILRSGLDNGHAGLRALATWSIDDNWEIGGSAELFARDTPLRALRHGITADATSTSLTYRVSESREFALGVQAMNFSDGNLRTGLTGQYTERLVTLPRFTIDGIVGLAGSANTADANRPYYNPSRDALATVGLSLNQTLYRRYELIYDHHLVVTPGAYWEQGFGNRGVGSVLYEHRLQIDDVVETGLGVNVSRQPYDGKYENAVAVLFNLRLRF